MTELLKKYDVPAPRYTSYPTVPYWSDSPTMAQWLEELKKACSPKDMNWSMYVHLPFCETLCTFCGCNTTITRNHNKERGYLDLLLKEFTTYLEKVPELKDRRLRQLHLGGGTPTFFSVEHLHELVEQILKNLNVDLKEFDGSIEVDPRRTKAEQLKALYDLGFRRVSMGVQDFDPKVQRLINRIQPYEMTEKLTREARDMGYSSVNYDLIYGLPKQELASFEDTIERTLKLKPDRIALYSFAKVPWIKPAQRLFKDEDLPEGAEKRALYERAYELLTVGGYREIGMDHFALPHDDLSKSLESGGLHRNFMGYTEMRTSVLLGIGVSAISETPTCFHQNEKVLPVYERKVGEGDIPTLRGHLLSADDQFFREQILKFMTQSQVELKDDKQVEDVRIFLQPLIEDGLVILEGRVLMVPESGRPFLRNACMALDQRLRSKNPDTQIFSSAM
ncbi:MAG: oxygen-independent coproporphyrinogen III oxidase [Bdellovibrionales bacterium]|nr:oxygen-independent coproporphyrinogen III oxidase [Bdellovibrionales bacterium]